ncbi:hypothetical protein FHR84_000884 [Actinopolyspora biskrensis]|uniref:DNA-binding transcriptional regulator, MarR family n=1 Tax=Actinopolyspora biskrensis TaxID=1470178 RepID=A0A852YU10_9ACTN|nr:MarR family transcriptional regulator [Actinopolyspora biskrensis]NYH77570.1 hypothetical protein [Actinopolyspora biskrensis]
MLQKNTTKRLGYWLVLLHQLFDSATERALSGEQLTRREWQVLHAVNIGMRTVSDVDKGLAPFLVEDEMNSYRGVLETFAERGWVVLDGGSIETTESGVLAHDRAEVLVNSYASGALEGITEEEFLATNDVLRRIALNLDPKSVEDN